MNGFSSGYNMPPGCYEWMIPGNRPQDAAWEAVLESVPEKCPKCGQPTEGDDDYGFADHVRVIEHDHDPEVRCEWVGEDDEGDPCEETLAGGNCRCRECDPPDYEPWDRD